MSPFQSPPPRRLQNRICQPHPPLSSASPSRQPASYISTLSHLEKQDDILPGSPHSHPNTILAGKLRGLFSVHRVFLQCPKSQHVLRDKSSRQSSLKSSPEGFRRPPLSLAPHFRFLQFNSMLFLFTPLGFLFKPSTTSLR